MSLTAFTGGETRTLRRSWSDRLLVSVGALLMVAITLVIAGLGFVVAFSSAPWVGAIMGVAAAGLLVLTYVVLREAEGRWMTRITLGPAEARFDLPARRGYADLAPVHLKVPYGQIAAIEVRDEAFSSLGVTMIQRAASLVLQDGARVDLGADRPMMSAYVGPAAAALAQRAGIGVRDLGMVDGKTGPLAVTGNTTPDWKTHPLSNADAIRRHRAAALSWRVLYGLVIAGALLKAVMAVVRQVSP